MNKILPPSTFTHAQRVAFARLERAISSYKIVVGRTVRTPDGIAVASDKVWDAALGVTCQHLLFVITKEERDIIRACVPPRVLLTRPLSQAEKEERT